MIWFFTSQSTIVQLCRDRSSWVKPVLSKDKCVLLKNKTHSDVGEAWTCGPSVLSQALYHWATVLPIIINDHFLEEGGA